MTSHENTLTRTGCGEHIGLGVAAIVAFLLFLASPFPSLIVWMIYVKAGVLIQRAIYNMVQLVNAKCCSKSCYLLSMFLIGWYPNRHSQ